LSASQNPQEFQPPVSDRLISVKEVCTIVGAGRHWVLSKSGANQFPRPIRLGARYTRFFVSDVQEWLKDPQAWISANADKAGEV